MGLHSYLEDNELGNLPEEAFGNKFDIEGPFDPDDRWLRHADRDDQLVAVREWFLARYCDPAEETPYDGREGGYLFIHGGPYDPADEIPDRFSGIVDEDVLEEVIDELHAEMGDAWAPVNWEPDYDDYLRLQPERRDAPGEGFRKRLAEIEGIIELASQGNLATSALLLQMSFGSIISAVEAFLAETVAYWIEIDRAVLRRVVSSSKEFKDARISVAEIFDRVDKIENEVQTYLGNQVWHRLDKLGPTIEHGLNIKLPDIRHLMKAVEKRHDIVHRAGKTKDGKTISLGPAELQKLISDSTGFVRAIEQSLEQSFPRTTGTEDF